MRASHVLPVVLAGLIACKSSTGPEGAPVTGRWTGSATGITMIVGFEETNGTLDVGGSFQYNGATLGFSGSGTHSKRKISFSIAASGFQQASFTGDLVGDAQISGHLSSSGFNGETLVLNKSP